MALLDHMVNLFLLFWGISVLFTGQVELICVLTCTAQRSLFSPSQTLITCFGEVILYCGFNLHSPGAQWCWGPFHWPFISLSWKNAYSDHLRILKLNCMFLFFYWIVWVLYIFWILAPYQIYDLHISSRLFSCCW